MAGAQIIDKAAPAVGPLIWLAFNLKTPKLAYKRVPQALSFAIDREFVVKGLAGGTVGRSTGPIASGSPFYSAEVERYDFNLTKAAQLLDAAGMRPGADGHRFAPEVDCPPGFAALKAIQEYMRPALAKVGVAVSARNSPDFPTWARRVAGQEVNLAKRKALSKEFQKIMVDDCPVAFIVESTWGEAWSRKVDNPPRATWGNIDPLADLGMRKA